MITKAFSSDKRIVKNEVIKGDFVVVGGGMAGVCAAITAARAGIKTILIQDRPVLGGNASSEVRLWILGATSHMGNNNRWAREGGVIDEILVENLFRNREGNPLIFDTILLEKVSQEENIRLLLNTSVFDIDKAGNDRVESVKAFCSQNSTGYQISAPLFCDASGDGILAFKAGASFRMGAETKEEFGELFAPDQSFGELLGHSMYFYSKRADEPVKYVPPSYALKDIKEIPRYKVISKEDQGCRYWWIEFGGRTDTIHNTEEIKWELWKVIYGIWDYIKNSGEFDDVENLTLEWVGTIPGKRESRRFEGHYMLKQQDVIEQSDFYDAVTFGGWTLDLHPADGIYSKENPCIQWHPRGIYTIPYRCYVSKDIQNLFFAGRIISATHVAFGSTRVMASCAQGAQAVGMAAALCTSYELLPAQLLGRNRMIELQDELNKRGQSIPGIPIRAYSNLVNSASITASSTLELSTIPFDGGWISLENGAAQLLPLKGSQAYSFRVALRSDTTTTLEVQLRKSSKENNYTPDVIMERINLDVVPGEQYKEFEFSESLETDQYAFVTFLANNKVQLRESNMRYSGILSLFNGENKAVSNNGKQISPDGIGIESFEFWIPFRRPGGKNIAMEISPAVKPFDVSNVCNGYVRPYGSVNAWSADLKDNKPTLTILWENKQQIQEVRLFFDTDYDHPMESTLYGHPEEVIPFCVRNYRISDLNGNLLYEKKYNYQTINTWNPASKLETTGLLIEFEHPSVDFPATVFEVLCT